MTCFGPCNHGAGVSRGFKALAQVVVATCWRWVGERVCCIMLSEDTEEVIAKLKPKGCQPQEQKFENKDKLPWKKDKLPWSKQVKP